MIRTMAGTVAVLEDDVGRLAELRACLPVLLPRFDAVYFDNAAEMIAWLADHLAETVLADGGWPAARVYPDADHTFVRLAWAAQVRRWIASGLIFG